MYTTLRNLKERPDVSFVDCEEEDLPSRAGAQFYIGKRTEKIEHEEIGTCAAIEISQDADNIDQKVKWFTKINKKVQTFVGSISLIIFFSQVFSHFHILQTFRFSPP